MSWGDAKPGGSYESVTALAVLSLVLSLTALLLPFAPAMLPPVGVVLLAALLLLPFAVAAAVTFAHWCWWRCARDSSIRGFGWALAAMIASHAVGAGWAIVVAAALLGPGGALLAGFTALMSFAAIAIAMRSAAAKYGLAAPTQKGLRRQPPSEPGVGAATRHRTLALFAAPGDDGRTTRGNASPALQAVCGFRPVATTPLAVRGGLLYPNP